METKAKTFKGVTAPISLKHPTELDLLENSRLLEAMRALDEFAGEEENRKRALALLALEEEAREWIIDQCRTQVSLWVPGNQQHVM